MAVQLTPAQRTELAALVRTHRFPEEITVTRPSMPPLERYTGLLEGIWERRWLTNNGELLLELERRLVEYLGVPHLSVFNNGATALLVMLQALRIDGGEVITTPFTFPATTHVLHWNGVTPVFCDIDPETFNIDPRRIEQLIGPRTRGILGVHVYGTPCDVEAIEAIGKRHGLVVMYDAAHAFGVRRNGQSILESGDMSMLSFHATKVFSTIEGGALVSRSDAERRRVNHLKNFGIADEETVIGPGINGKMNEFQAAFGLLQLDTVDREIELRGLLAARYRERLRGLDGLRLPPVLPGVRQNFGYFPVLIDQARLGISRDQLHLALRELNIITRKYFYPLVSRAPCYAALESAQPQLLPVAEAASRNVLCLPIYGTLPPGHVETICDAISRLAAH